MPNEGHTIAEVAYPGEYMSQFGALETKTCKIRLSRKGQGLLARMYASRGYHMQATLSHESDLSSLVVQIDGQAQGTISIRMDDGYLAAEEHYPEFIGELRQRGARICEMGKLAMDPGVRSKQVLGAIFHIAWIAAFKARRATDLVIEVNPRHAPFYRCMLRFDVLGPERMCGRVGAPAVLLHISAEKGRGLIEKFGGQPRLSSEERSFYPYFFHPDDEEGLMRRLSVGG